MRVSMQTQWYGPHIDRLIDDEDNVAHDGEDIPLCFVTGVTHS